MTKQKFAALHTGSEPLVLFNIWDAGSAKAVASSGAKAIGTGSLSLAGAQGYDDGETISFRALLTTVERIVKSVDLPVSIDIDTGYADDLETLTENARLLVQAGAVGCNLEDQMIGLKHLRDPQEQASRIAAVDGEGLFVNARTDLFLEPLMAGEDPNRDDLVEAALERAAFFKEAGAGCLFVPGLSQPDLIARLCARSGLPVNVMRLPRMGSNAQLAELGVARISYGPGPWRDVMATLEAQARAALAS